MTTTGTQHLHAEIVPGCFRCELGQDEAAAAEAETLPVSPREQRMHDRKRNLSCSLCPPHRKENEGRRSAHGVRKKRKPRR